MSDLGSASAPVAHRTRRESTPRVITTKVRVPGNPGGLERDRLLDLATDLSQHRLVLVVAPAGAGKTTLLAQMIRRCDGTRVWYRADAGDRTSEAFLRHLRAAARCAGIADTDMWRSPDDVVCGLEAAGPTTIGIDDLHTLNGSVAMEALGRILAYLPDRTTVLAASRTTPDLPLPRWRVRGHVLELDADDLRFRTWEAESLYRAVYNEPLPPEEVALLTRRTQGWAAGLQLYHLATTGKARHERQRLLETLRAGSPLLREYLTADVLHDLEPRFRRFLLETCVLGTLTPRLCDDLRGQTDSASHLQELADRQIFTSRVDHTPTYRYHEVLRRHLEATLVKELGEHEAQKRYRRAGELLAEAGHLADSLRAYCHAQVWEEAAAIVRRSDLAVSTRSGDWITELPDSFVADDPSLLLVRARREVAVGRFDAALRTYRAGEETDGPANAVDRCVQERLMLSTWVSREPVPAHGANGLLREATRESPLAILRELAPAETPQSRLLQATLAILGGDVSTATSLVDKILHDPGTTALCAALARVVAAVSSWLHGSPPSRDEIIHATDTLDELGFVWPARVATATLALCDPSPLDSVELTRAGRERADDPWGVGLAGLLEGLGSLGESESAADALEAAADAFQRIDAPVLEAWTRSALALAGATSEEASAEQIDRAQSLARTVGCPGALLLAAVAGARERGPASADAEMADSLERQLGISMDHLRRHVGRGADAAALPAGQRATPGLRCFGRFVFDTGEQALDVAELKPQVRLGLFFLAVNVGRAVHRGEIAEVFWPDGSQEAAIRNVQVLVSSMRSAVGDINGVTIARRGEAYELVLEEGLESDIRRLEQLVDAARRARALQDRRTEHRILEQALELYAGEVLPEAGPRDWLETPRRRSRSQAAEVAERLAEWHLAADDPSRASRYAERGLEIDRFHDPLWHLLVEAHEQAGDVAGRSLACRRYASVLSELGLDPEEALAMST